MSQFSQTAQVVPLAGDVDRNAWAEVKKRYPGVVPLAGDVDRNPPKAPDVWGYCPSSPSRGTWIEIALNGRRFPGRSVVPLAGDVDRNHPLPGA